MHALERDRRFEFAWKHLRSYDEVWGPLLDEARQLHAAGQLFENVREEQEEEVPEMVAMLAEPEEQGMDDHESNASTDVAQDHMRDPEVEWLEPLVEAPVEHLRNECRTSSRFAWCGVRPRPVTCDMPRHAAKNGSVFGSNCLFTNVFFFSEFLVATAAAAAAASWSHCLSSRMPL